MVLTEQAILTNSRLKAARACQRKHHYQYDLGYRPVDDAHALRFGTLIHLGLEAWWRAWQLPAEERLAAALAAVEHEADPFDLVRAQEMLRGYHFRWKDEPLEVLGVEVEFLCELRNPATGQPSRTWVLGGKLDVIVRTPDGRVLIIEHKTSSEDIRPGSSYYLRLRMDGQVSVYFEGATSLGYDVAGCLYDVLGKPGLRPLKANTRRTQEETPEEYRLRLREDIASDPSGYYQRADVVRLESEMADALHDIWQLAQQIRESERAGRYPRNPDSCVQYGRPCPFFAACAGEASIDDPTRFRKSEVLHPELSIEQAQESAR